MCNSKGKILLSFFILPVLLLLTTCIDRGYIDFGKIKANKWYSAKLNEQKYYFNFTSVSKSKAEGICFIDNGRLNVNPGNVSVSNDLIKIKIDDKSDKISGKWCINDNSVIFIRSKKDSILFKLMPEFVIPEPNDRYKKNITEKVIRKEVNYGYARGFYTSKNVGNMNAESYPQIISGVLSELGSNLFTDNLPLKMDIYQPKYDSVKSRPLLVLVHGGAFIVGDKRDDFQKKLAMHYAKMGYVVASINYRLGYLFIPGAYSNLERCIYRAIQDTRAAIRWLIANSKKYGIDKNYIFLAGNSAGGFIALKTAFMAESESFSSISGNLFMLQDDLGCLDCSGNNHKEKFRLKGVINMWGALTDIEMMDEFEKMPLLLIHGDSDKIVPYGFDYPFKNVGEKYSSFFSNKVYGSKPIYDKALEMGFPVSLITVQNAGHEPQVDENNAYTPFMSQLLNAMDSFLYAQLSADTISIKNLTGNLFGIQTNVEFDKVLWEIKGGCILDNSSDKSVRIVRFSNAGECILSATIIQKNGIVRKTKLTLTDVKKINGN